MSDYLPKFEASKPFTLSASAAVTGGRLVVVTGDRTVGPAGADAANAIGVAGFDGAIGDAVTIYPLPGTVHKLIASAAIAAGARIITAAGGKVATIGGGTNAIAVALVAAAADGDVVEAIGI